MRRLSAPAALRRGAAGLAAAGLLTVTGLAAVPAHAADPDPVFTLSGPSDVGLHAYPASGKPKKAVADFEVTNPSKDEEKGSYDGEYTLTFDLSGLAGVADVRFDPEGGGSSECKITGTLGVCHDYGIWPGINDVARLEITPAKGSKVGASGTIKVTGRAEGATFTSHSTKVEVGGVDLVMKPLNLKQEIKPGEAQPARLTFANTGTSAAPAVLVTLIHSHGIEIPERYSNCEYTRHDDGFFGAAYSKTVCVLDGPFEPGAVYELTEPFTLKAAKHAFYEDFVYRVTENSPSALRAERGGAAFTRGTGAPLTLKKQSAAPRGADLNPWDNQQEQGFRAKNTADFAAYGTSVAKAAAGETVKATIGFRNNGPAWVAYLRSGEDIGTVDVKVPQGATVTRKPKSCHAVTTSGDWREKQLGAPRYFCNVPAMVLENEDFALPFEMKIEKVVKQATGSVTVRNWFEGEPALHFDPSMRNNTAKIVLNGKDDTGSTSGSGSTTSSGGSTSGSGGSTGGSTGGSSSGSASGTGGGASGGSADSGSTSGSGSGSGGLASTGTTAMMAGGVAAAALAIGTALYVKTRRRPAQR
ncbi:peptidase [Streptomyces sp. NPDC019396]|uniref:peptidase n=1 Tax=Streptomyces sp. NPDC019396 TaxID=3154687 RepID=UPI0033CB21BF